MQKRTEESTRARLVDSVDSNVAAKPYVRYVGFESINSGRRLRFRVKSNRHESVDVTLDIDDAVFIGSRGIFIQDAAPMAYEKLVELLAEGTLESEKLFLTSVDVARYINRHMSSQKRAHLLSAEKRQSYRITAVPLKPE